MSRVLVTGSSGEIGRRVVALLAKEHDCEVIAGIDIRSAPTLPEGFVFHQVDIRAPLVELMRQQRIDTVVHCAFIVQPIHDAALMEDVNVNGAANLLRASAIAGVKQIIQLSSATAYGFHAGTREPFAETAPLRPFAEFQYALHKQRVEGMMEDFARENPGTIVTVLRPSLIVGRDFANPVMRYFENPVVPIPRRDQPLQVTHVNDLAGAVRLLVRNRTGGVFNVGAEGTMTVAEMIGALNNRAIEVPLPLLRALNGAAWRCRLTRLAPGPSASIEMLRYPWVVSSRKLLAETGFHYGHSSREAFYDFAAGSRMRRFGYAFSTR